MTFGEVVLAVFLGTLLANVARAVTLSLSGYVTGYYDNATPREKFNNFIRGVQATL